MKQTFKRFLPEPLLFFKRMLHVALLRRYWARLTVAEVFREIYDRSLWGDKCRQSALFRIRLSRQRAQAYVDFVRALTSRHRIQSVVDSSTVQFRCLDMTPHSLPSADACLVRQVFQHLSNDEIRRVLPRLQANPFVLVTEHYPAEAHVLVPNKDEPHGTDTRSVDGSGVYLDQPPFGQAADLVLSVDAEERQVAKGETIRTFLIRRGGDASAP